MECNSVYTALDTSISLYDSRPLCRVPWLSLRNMERSHIGGSIRYTRGLVELPTFNEHKLSAKLVSDLMFNTTCGTLGSQRIRPEPSWNTLGYALFVGYRMLTSQIVMVS